MVSVILHISLVVALGGAAIPAGSDATQARGRRGSSGPSRPFEPPSATLEERAATGSSGLIGWFTFADLGDGDRGTAIDHSGMKNNGRIDPSAASKAGLGVGNATAVRFYGNGTGLSIPEFDVGGTEELSVAMWVNFFWGDATLVAKEGTVVIELYRQMLEVELETSGGKIEHTWYPAKCAFLTPGSWHHVIVTYSKHGHTELYMDGTSCGQAKGGGGSLKHSDHDLTTGSFSGWLADFRVYGRQLGMSDVAGIYTPTAQQIYRTTAVAQVPAAAEIKARGLGWYELPVTEADTTMYQAWLNYDNAGTPTPATATPASTPTPRTVLGAYSIHSIVVSPTPTKGSTGAPTADHPAVTTAAEELEMIFPRAVVIAGAPPMTVHLRGGAVVLHLCGGDVDSYPQLWRQAASSACVQLPDHEAFALRVLNGFSDFRPTVLIASSGPAGVLYGAWALRRLTRLGTPLTAASINRLESPVTNVRCINLWSQWRGFPYDSWMTMPAGRADSIFSWADLRRGGNTTKIAAWVRLLSSVGVNAIAPQDVNWDQRNNYLDHLDEVAALGPLLRKYAIRLFWTPNFLLAPNRSTADALFKAVPDFGGYLLKIGSEKQGGKPTPDLINVIADTLVRTGDGESNGTVLLRGFIYGSEFRYPQQNRMAIPAAFFGPFDGQYRPNVHILGKYTALDFETAEPINALDGLLKKTKYGAEWVVGKDFPMSWVRNWQAWLDFDNGRGGSSDAKLAGTGGAADTTLLNRDCIDSLLGVAMINPLPSWEANPLNMVNYYAFGRLAWSPSLATDDIYAEWVGLTFGPAFAGGSGGAGVLGAINLTEGIVNALGMYHGYRGVWYEIQADGSFRSPNSVHQKLDRTGAGTVKSIADELTNEFSPKVKAIYADHTDPRSEEVLLEWDVFPLDYKLVSGATIKEDMLARPPAGVSAAKAVTAMWAAVGSATQAAVGFRFYNYTAGQLASFVQAAEIQAKAVQTAVGKL